MHGTAKVLGSSPTRTCFFFRREKFNFNKNCRQIICLLIFCRIFKSFFLLHSVFLVLLLVFYLPSHFVILLTMTSYFPFFLVNSSAQFILDYSFIDLIT